MILPRMFVCFTLLALFSQVSLAQSSSPSFEVASIKTSDPNVRNIMLRNTPGGGFSITGATLKILIELAYDIRDFQISGGPGWINSDHYDINAKAEPESGESPPDQRKAMELQRQRLRALLADRFLLKIRRETKEHQIYALTLAKGGPKLKESVPGNPGPDQNGDKGPQRFRGAGTRVSPGHIMGQSAPLDILIQALSQFVGSTVIDKTGLKGTYDFELEWTPDTGLGQGMGGPGESSIGKEPPRPESPAPAEPSGPSLFTALQEQLGLKLESQKGPVETIVIESVEKPSEN